MWLRPFSGTIATGHKGGGKLDALEAGVDRPDRDRPLVGTEGQEVNCACRPWTPCLLHFGALSKKAKRAVRKRLGIR